MFCRNCGEKMEDTAEFCPNCGAVVEKKPMTENDNKYTKIFVEPDEKYIGSLGNSYLNSFLTGKRIKRCVALLSDKRVYLRGNMIVTDSKIGRVNKQKTVDLEDITGTGFIYASPEIGQLILAIISLPFGIMGIVGAISEPAWAPLSALLVLSVLFFAAYLKSRKTYFTIEYAGGGIQFETSIYGLAESQDFEKQIRRAKNKVKENK